MSLVSVQLVVQILQSLGLDGRRARVHGRRGLWRKCGCPGLSNEGGGSSRDAMPRDLGYLAEACVARGAREEFASLLAADVATPREAALLLRAAARLQVGRYPPRFPFPFSRSQ